MASKKYAEARAKYNEVKKVDGFTDGTTLDNKIKALDNAIKTEITKQTNEAFTPESTKYLFGFIKLSGNLRSNSEDNLKSVIETAKSQGDTSVNYINAVNNLAKFYRIKLDFAKAEEQYKIALQACDKLLKDQQDRKATIKDVSTFNTINNLGVLYLDQGILDTEKGFNSKANLKYKKAMYMFKRNFFVYQDDITNSSNWTADNKLNYALVIFYIAETLSQMKKIPEAFVMYSKAKELVDSKNIEESSLSSENKETLRTLITTLNYKIKTKIKLDNSLTFESLVKSFRDSYEKEAEEVKKEEKDQADVKNYEAYANKDASDIYIKIELYGLIGFCTGFGEIDITKKIANKTIFIKTILDLSKFKEAAKKGGIWNYFKGRMTTYGQWIKTLFSNKTDEELKRTQTDNILMEITKKNLLSSLFINNVSGLGFLLDKNSNNIVDDSIIFNSGNASSSIRWIDISPGSGFYKASSSMLTGIQKVIGERSLEAVLGSLFGYGAGSLVSYGVVALSNMTAFGTDAVVSVGSSASTADVAVGNADASVGSAAGTAAVAVGNAPASVGALTIGGIAVGTIGWTVAIASVVIIVGAEVYAYSNNPNPNSVLDNLLAKYIYTFITDGSIDVDSLEGVDPTQVFINNLCDIISITEGAFFKADLIKTSRRLTYNYQEAILTEVDKDQMAIFSKQNVNKLSIDKKLLTNLNIPIKAFAHALMEVKSTDVKENRLKLEEYYENKDAVLEKLKKEKEKR
jgi:tetratricopeptide (TPR) repeat protein